MIRRPPRSTLFPTRRSSDLPTSAAGLFHLEYAKTGLKKFYDLVSGHARSEEHTSELQSPCNLVCRLLLEKKKNKIAAIHSPISYQHTTEHAYAILHAFADRH